MEPKCLAAYATILLSIGFCFNEVSTSGDGDGNTFVDEKLLDNLRVQMFSKNMTLKLRVHIE